ncbi:fused response regulator/phosphatase [Phaeobacter sp. B1627]|nr:fused response regulator/phosphatase [Phaeobacter sp. B1627]TNJ45618.1 fused response regulator/phosphatase [Phaeobacter sp. B1627]
MSGSIRRVLVVDDSRLQRRILVASLKKWGFEVVEAEGGEEAIEICRADPPDLILSDWMMPGMNGIEFCRAFRAEANESYSYFILLTSKSEKNEIAEGLDAGADDFLTKPVSSDELRARISAGERILRMQRELFEKNRIVSETLGELQTVYDAIDKDLIQARKIQESLVPELSRAFGKSEVNLLLKPCGHIGGDLVGMFSPGVNRIGFYSIDVSGHGITSAMMTARLGGYLSSTYFDQNVGMEKKFNRFYALRPPEEVASVLNARLIADAGIEEYFTMAYCIADLRTGVIKMVQAGHPHPLLLRADGSMEFIGKGGVPVGLVPDIGYDQEEFVMEKGDRLLLYSDGFTEAHLKDGSMLDTEGLVNLVERCNRNQSGKAFLDELYQNLTDVMGDDKGLEDDISATLFEFQGP